MNAEEKALREAREKNLAHLLKYGGDLAEAPHEVLSTERHRPRPPVGDVPRRKLVAVSPDPARLRSSGVSFSHETTLKELLMKYSLTLNNGLVLTGVKLEEAGRG